MRISNRNRRRMDMLESLFNPTIGEPYRRFTDPDLAVEAGAGWPLVTAAGNCLASGYESAAICDANDPIPTLALNLESFLGGAWAYRERTVVFAGPDDAYRLQTLTCFDSIGNRFVRDASTRFGCMLPGRMLGEVHETLIVEWRWIPRDYLLAVRARPCVDGGVQTIIPGVAMHLTTADCYAVPAIFL